MVEAECRSLHSRGACYLDCHPYPFRAASVVWMQSGYPDSGCDTMSLPAETKFNELFSNLAGAIKDSAIYSSEQKTHMVFLLRTVQEHGPRGTVSRCCGAWRDPPLKALGRVQMGAISPMTPGTS